MTLTKDARERLECFVDACTNLETTDADRFNDYLIGVHGDIAADLRALLDSAAKAGAEVERLRALICSLGLLRGVDALHGELDALHQDVGRFVNALATPSAGDGGGDG